MNHAQYPQSDSDPNRFQIQFNAITSLVYGYTRRIKLSLNIRYIPVDMIEIIIKYYPKKYEILSIGRNLFGEFGLNEETENNNHYVSLTQFASLCYHHNEIYCGFFTFTVRTEHNDFYGCGNNCDGQLGVNIHEYNVTQFNKIALENDQSIGLFSEGAFSWHRIFVTQNNTFYGFGRNKNATLGYSGYPEKNYKPIPLSNLTQLFTHRLQYKIKSIQCGASHTLFLCQNGKLFGVGENDHGQCGIPSNKCNIRQPTEITHIPRIIACAVGEYFTLCISHSHNLWVFGSNSNYELGMDRDDWKEDDEDELDDDDNLDIWIPKRSNYFYERGIKIYKIRCGESHSLVIGSDAAHNGYVYCCGQNTHGESLGKYLDLSTQHKYDPICFQSAVCDYSIVIEDASCGNTHTMLLTDTNEIYGFGANDHGQVAVGIKQTKIHKPYLLKKAQIGIDEDNRIERVIAGCYTTLIVCNRL